jgi:hypothetical protein
LGNHEDWLLRTMRDPTRYSGCLELATKLSLGKLQLTQSFATGL